MEILILLAGEQIGPFSEQRVREYLEQGLVTPTDLAIADGMTEWQAVDYLLAHLAATPVVNIQNGADPNAAQGPINREKDAGEFRAAGADETGETQNLPAAQIEIDSFRRIGRAYGCRVPTARHRQWAGRCERRRASGRGRS